MLADPQVLLDNQWPHNVDLLHEVRRRGCKLGLATMTYCTQALRVLEVLNLADAFDFVATRDDVERGKPDPEIYLLVAEELGVPPGECLVIEDSPSGVRAALAAGMRCVCVTTPFSREMIRAGDLLGKRWIVDESATLGAVVRAIMAEQEEGGSG